MRTKKILIVDDEPLNLDILEEYLTDAGYAVITALHGKEGLQRLAEHKDVAVILLDRMMPEMDGMQFMEKISRDLQLRNIPVIMQTAASSSQEILDGLRSGVFYYLTKPFERDVILNVVRAALDNGRPFHEAPEAAHQELQEALALLTSCEFSFRSMEEAEQVGTLAAHLFPDPARTALGLCELAYNAVEHGNLGISYDEKNQLILEGRLKAEITHRLKLPEYQHRVATLKIRRLPEGTEAIISDMGAGFDHRAFHNIDPLKITRLNGRGISIARMMSFDTMHYNAEGNAVTCWCDSAAGLGSSVQTQAQRG